MKSGGESRPPSEPTINAAMLSAFRAQLPRVYPLSDPDVGPIIERGIADDLIGLIREVPELSPVVRMFAETYAARIRQADDAARVEALAAIIASGKPKGMERLFCVDAALRQEIAGLPPALEQLFLERRTINRPEQEPDVEPEDRLFLSDALAEERRPQGITLSMRQAVPLLDVTMLRNEMLAGVIEHTEGTSRWPFRRKNVEGKRVLLRLDADIIYGREFQHTRMMSIDGSFINYGFTRPLVLDDVKRFFERQAPALTVVSTNVGDKMPAVSVLLGETPLLIITPQTIHVPYAMALDSADTLRAMLYQATRFIEAIVQDQRFSPYAKVVNLHELRPFIDAFKGTKPSSEFADLGQFVAQQVLQKRNPRTFPFNETRASWSERNRAYSLGLRGDDLPAAKLMLQQRAWNFPPHTRYVLVSDGATKELILGFDINLDPRSFKPALERLAPDLVVEEGVSERNWKQRGSRIPRKTTEWRISQAKTGAEPRLLMSFTSLTARIPIRQGDGGYARALAVLDHVMNEGTFQTSTVQEGRFRKGLTQEEETLLPVWENLLSLYNTFVRPDLEHRLSDAVNRGEPLREPPSAVDWITDRLRVSGETDPSMRLLFVLREIHRTIDPARLLRYGPHAQERYLELTLKIGALDETFSRAQRAQPAGAPSAARSETRPEVRDERRDSADEAGRDDRKRDRDRRERGRKEIPGK